ncbi:MAG TPA: ABC transporter permease, partial [Pseudonocardiaceae bacterium]|nr:ABC transporter permease [Pseudonocardiaceae bacterium]
MSVGGVPGLITVSRRRKGTRSYADLLSTPLIVLLGGAAVALWVSTRTLDDIEARALQPSAILSDLGQHLILTAYSTLFVIVIAVPLGILLSRKGARRIRNVVLAVGGFAQALPPYGVL